VRLTARWRAAAASLAVVLAACGGSGVKTPPPAPTDGAPSIIDGTVDGAACQSVIEMHPDEGALHLPCTEATQYQTNPPSSGNHYNCWAAYQTYTTPIPWGNLVHSLEHGAIVMTYNCPDGCAADVAAMQAFIDAQPLDPQCGGALGKNRLILVPDPDLDVRFAASSWGWTLKADCFDPAAFQQFFNDHYDHGREVICTDGWMGDELCAACPYG
jgi:Protein of unknown function (DUF3105)